MRTYLCLALALTSACKKSDDKKTDQAAKPTVAETTKTEAPTTEPPKTESPKPVPAAAPVKAATLASGETLQGCFAWSPKIKSAACIVGDQETGEREVTLVHLGSTETVQLADSLDQPSADKENAKLAADGYLPMTDKALDVPAGAKTPAGGALSLTWSIKQTKKGGNNVAPSSAGKVVATCNGKDTTLWEQKEEEGRTFTVSMRTFPTHTIVEVKTDLGREGEYGHGFHAFLIDTASCAVASGE